MSDNQDKNFTDNIVLRIRTVAKDRNISLVKLAEAIEMTDTGLYRMLENGSFKVLTLKKIADALGVTCAELMGEHSNTPESKVYNLMREVFKEVQPKF